MHTTIKKNNLLPCLVENNHPNPNSCVIWLHGLGSTSENFAAIVPEIPADQTAAIRFVFPQAPTQSVSRNGGEWMASWYDLYGAELLDSATGERKEDAVGLKQAQTWVEALIQEQINQGMPANRIALAGFSQGCATVLYTVLHTKFEIAGVIGLSGYVPLSSRLNSLSDVDTTNLKTPLFIAHGTKDDVVDFGRGMAARNIFLELGYNVEWKTYPMAHSVCMEEIEDIRVFLQKIFA